MLKLLTTGCSILSVYKMPFTPVHIPRNQFAIFLTQTSFSTVETIPLHFKKGVCKSVKMEESPVKNVSMIENGTKKEKFQHNTTVSQRQRDSHVNLQKRSEN